MSHRTRGVVASRTLLSVLVLVAGGCSATPPAIDAPTMDEATASACRDLVADLPATLAGHDRVDATGDTTYGAAWGDPAIVLTCGVGQPAGFSTTSTCVQIDGTGWFVPDDVLLSSDETLDVTTTELNFRPRVELVIPGEYRPNAFTNGIAQVGALIEKRLTRVGRCK